MLGRARRKAKKAGFQIDDANYIDDCLAAYLCTKKAGVTAIKSLTAAARQLP
jgi:hypothetical protein